MVEYYISPFLLLNTKLQNTDEGIGIPICKALTMKSVIIIPICICLFTTFSTSKSLQYNAIFNFGDSISDTGNILFIAGGDSPAAKLPYGETFFGGPTGRLSDGRLIIDFIAEAFGMPYLPPYLSLTNGTTPQIQRGGGANFAVSGATALDPEFFYRRKIVKRVWVNESLSVQLGWFRKLKATLCTTLQDCDGYLKKSLFVVGEIGGNDLNLWFFNSGTIPEVEALVPPVVEAISSAIITLIEEGAVELVVPGNFPIGCSVVYRNLFHSENKELYDSNGCLKALNAVSELYNSQLKRSLETLSLEYPHTNIVYADYYDPVMQFVAAPERYGFRKETIFEACYDPSLGSKTSCEDHFSYANWDGIHLTESAYRIIAEAFITASFDFSSPNSSDFI